MNEKFKEIFKKFGKRIVAIGVGITAVICGIVIRERNNSYRKRAREIEGKLLVPHNDIENQLKTELKKQSESYKKLEREKVKTNVVVGVACFIVGAVAGGVAYGVYVYPWLSK